MKPMILLIEDNVQNRYLLTYLLEQHGYRVVSAVDGPSGVALFQTARPGLVLLDIQLPGMDGHAVARALRSLDPTRAVPIVAVTSYAMVGDREKCLEAGCDGYLEKPINPETFVAEISRFHPPGAEQEPPS
ncbi:MAG: response regulator [Xanthomonadales bacterium]|nr:response regulator [Xanthomonadales bacterium]